MARRLCGQEYQKISSAYSQHTQNAKPGSRRNLDTCNPSCSSAGGDSLAVAGPQAQKQTCSSASIGSGEKPLPSMRAAATAAASSEPDGSGTSHYQTQLATLCCRFGLPAEYPALQNRCQEKPATSEPHPWH